MRASHVLWLSCAVVLAGCPEARYASVLDYNFSADLPASAPGYHYEQFATINGSVVSLGTFVVRYDVALSQFDVGSDGRPNRRRAVVNVGFEAYPEGDPSWGDPTPGSIIYGVLDGSDPTTSLPVGGVEIMTPVDCTGATEIFITVEPDDRGTALPSHDVVLQGYLTQKLQGALAGELTNPDGYARINGHVSVVVLVDDVI
ncbi:MAG: hypothetical protein HY906_11170 [Deltaproteobacteria bacterium]|nr:hypothetical protein [Deltaproteobacteria bacterium]